MNHDRYPAKTALIEALPPYLTGEFAREADTETVATELLNALAKRGFMLVRVEVNVLPH